FAPLDDTGSQLLFRFVAAAYERRSLGLASHWPFEQWGRFLPVPTTAASLLDRLLHHAVVVVTAGESFRMREARARTAGRAALMQGLEPTPGPCPSPARPPPAAGTRTAAPTASPTASSTSAAGSPAAGTARRRGPATGPTGTASTGTTASAPGASTSA